MAPVGDVIMAPVGDVIMAPVGDVVIRPVGDVSRGASPLASQSASVPLGPSILLANVVIRPVGDVIMGPVGHDPCPTFHFTSFRETTHGTIGGEPRRLLRNRLPGLFGPPPVLYPVIVSI